jgi:hypothetical protein
LRFKMREKCPARIAGIVPGHTVLPSSAAGATTLPPADRKLPSESSMSTVTIASPVRARADRAFYTWAGLVAVLIVFAGFARTYYLKGLYGAPSLTPLVHLHGLVMTLWFTLFVVQARLVAIHRVAWHRRLGLFGGGLAVVVVGVGTVTAITAAALGHSPGPPPLVFLTVPLGDIVVFTTLVSLGLAFRQRPDLHKRLLLLSSVGMLTAAIARIPLDLIHNGGVPVYFALTDVCVLGCIGVDAVKTRRLNPAFGWGLLFIAASQAGRLWLSGTPQWLHFATWLTR